MIWIQFHKYIQEKQHLTWLFTDASKTLRSAVYFQFSNYNMYEFIALCWLEPSDTVLRLHWAQENYAFSFKVIVSAAVAATVTSHQEGLCFTSLVSWSLSVDLRVLTVPVWASSHSLLSWLVILNWPQVYLFITLCWAQFYLYGTKPQRELP